MKGIEKKADLRLRRTYKLLTEALMSLLEEKSFVEIRVTDICDRAMVNRTTFYKHFEDKYHLLEFCIKEIQKNFNEVDIAYYGFDDPKQYCMNMLRNVLAYLSANKNKWLLIMTKNNNESIITVFHKLVVMDIVSNLAYYEQKGITYPIPVPVIAEFHAGALISLSRWWLENNLSISAEELFNYTDLMINWHFSQKSNPAM